MDFDFSQEQYALRAELKKMLARECPLTSVRRILDGQAAFDRELWTAIGGMGIAGVSIPEEFGGLGLGYLELCVAAEECGRVLAPVPLSSSAYLATELILLAGTIEQKRTYLPRLAAGEAIGCLALTEGAGAPHPAAVRSMLQDGRVTGIKDVVADGDIADFAIFASRAEGGGTGISLSIVDLDQGGVTRTPVRTIDPTRSHARIAFDRVNAQPMACPGEGWQIIDAVLDRAAVLTSFEQLGGAERTMEMARDYALDRMAFGRPIGSFQAIKHMIADMFVEVTLARSNCYFAAWALSTDAPDHAESAAIAHFGATRAFQLCARNNIQVHGGIGFTWEADCHLYYRRANLLALSLGGASFWEDRLVRHLGERVPAASQL
jgi:acyl-CoA dehydrogenase